ncbi:reverse transcriptase domain-containing protein [Tanacetum coccineum]
MFNSTLTSSVRVWFDDLPPESVNSYDDLKKAFLENSLQQKKYIKDPVEIHHIKQREGESTEDFVQRFKSESRHVKEAPECMRILGFMHEITNPELIKRLHDNIPKLVDEMMRVTTVFLRGEVAASNQAQKKTLPVWKQQEAARKQNFDRRQIEELIKAGKLSHVIKELKQGSKKDQPKTLKKGEASGKDQAMTILMVQPWKRVARQRATQSFSPDPDTSFPPLGDEDRAEGPMIIKAEIGEERIKVAIHPEYSEQTVAIGSTLTKEGRKALCGLLRRNLDIFAWKPEDMTGVPRHLAEHRLNVREGCPPVRQKKRSQVPERNKAIQEEVEKLINVGIMKEVHYHSWLPNLVMVKKHDNSRRMCVDFKDLNKECPKDGYPLQEIDYKIESLWATYQRLADKAFQKQIGRHLEVYVDDLVIKSRTEQEITRDIEETFKTLREINMKLNPKK